MTDRSTAEEHTNFHPWPEERFCLTTGAYILLSTSFEHRILFRVLVIVDLILIFTMVALICLENVEHQARRTAKRAKLKAIISPEYLKQLREEHKKKGPMNPEDLTENQVSAEFPVRDCEIQGPNKRYDEPKRIHENNIEEHERLVADRQPVPETTSRGKAEPKTGGKC